MVLKLFQFETELPSPRFYSIKESPMKKGKDARERTIFFLLFFPKRKDTTFFSCLQKNT